MPRSRSYDGTIGKDYAFEPLFSPPDEGNTQRSPDCLTPADVGAGMIQQSSAGIYSWLPMGLKVMRKIEQVVREEQNRAGANEILMPTIQPAELWQESGRYDDYGLEMLRIKDRHERDMLYGPTNEEQVTDILPCPCEKLSVPCRSISIISSGNSEMRCGPVSGSCAGVSF